MHAIELAKEIKVAIENTELDDKYLITLFNHSIAQLEYLSKIDSLLCKIYEEKKIIPLLNKIRNKLDDSNTSIEKIYNEFVELYSRCENLHATFVEKTPLFEDLEKEINDSLNNKIEEYDDKFNKQNAEFSKKLTDIQTSLGIAQTNSAAIETLYKNATASGNAITSIESEYNSAKNDYTNQKTKYDELILSIEKKENEIEEIKNKKSTELDSLQKELDNEKEKIKDILGSANMASMAKSFLERKNELKKPIQTSERWKNWGLILLFTGILGILIYELYIGFDYARFTYHLPVTLPLVWLVWTNTQRNNHLIRVQEEYAYKAAVAIAFEGYQRKVDESEDKDLKALLLELSVRNMGDNPVRLFDKNVKNSPFESIFEKIFPEKNKKESE